MNSEHRSGTVLELQERLLKTEKALERAERLATAGKFATIIVHEINNPVEAIANLAYLLREDHIPTDGLHYLDLMEEQIQRVATITRQALGFSRTLEHPVKADLVELVTVAMRTHSHTIANKQIEVDLDLPRRVVCEVYPGEVIQAVSNLVSNAIDASEPGGRLVVRMRARTSHHFITVCDTGSGIPHTMKHVLFDAFATGKEAGNGLGLWICRRIVERHGGNILWRSSTRPERHGTAFRISIDHSRPLSSFAQQAHALRN